MVWKKYEDQTKDEVVQNRFTAYLNSAVNRQRGYYITKINSLNRIMNFEEIIKPRFDLEKEAFNDLPLSLRIENEDLFLAVAELSEKERYVFFRKALGELTMDEMAKELGISYKGVASIYYRTIQKLRKRMQGGKK